MRRRTFVAGVLVATAAGRAQAQQPAKVYRIAIVYPSTPVAEQRKAAAESPRGKAFWGELRRLGLVEGRNVVVERYSSGGRTEDFAELARDVVRSNPDVIYTDGTRFMLAFKAATTTIP